MMFTELYRYLLQHKQLSVPGIGTFLLERKAAEVDFPHKKIIPPVYSFTLRPTGSMMSKSFFSWLAAVLQVSDRDAVLRFNDFAFDMKRQINNGVIIDWNGVGELRKGATGEIEFSPSPKELIPELPITAEKLIRENAGHKVRVGEEDKTSAEMVEYFSQPRIKRSLWWVYALILVLLSSIFIGWYLYEHGITISSVANQEKITPIETTNAYKTP